MITSYHRGTVTDTWKLFSKSITDRKWFNLFIHNPDWENKKHYFL